MVIESLKIKNNHYYWDDMVYLNDFNENLIKVVKAESRIGVDICYLGYIVKRPQHNINSTNLLTLIIRHIYGRVEKIEGSSDRYLVVDSGNAKLISILDKMFSFVKDKIDKITKDDDKITFGNMGNKITGYNKFRFSSDVDLPLDTFNRISCRYYICYLRH